MHSNVLIIMQNFYINKGSILPVLRMELICDDPYSFNRFFEALQDATVTFTMVDIETGNAKILNAPCDILPKENEGCSEEYVIQYNWKERDTKFPGQYRGQFNIKFNGNISSEGVQYPEGNLIVPIQEELMIFVQEGSIKK